MDLGYSGGYYVWVSNQYADGSFHPCDDPKAVVLAGGAPPHTPRDVAASSDRGGRTVDLSWKPELYGTWLYWIAAYHVETGAWVETQGPAGAAVWQHVAHPVPQGPTNLTVPQSGSYWFLVLPVAWDAQTWGEAAAAYVVVP